MKKYRNLLILPAVIVIIISVFSGFTHQNEVDNVKSLLTQRTHIMQQTFYEQMTLPEAEKQLLSIETYPLLKEDIENLRSWENGQLDVVKKMDFISIQKNRDFLGYTTFHTSIYWDMAGLSENYTMRGDYYVVLRQEGGIYKLSKFESL